MPEVVETPPQSQPNNIRTLTSTGSTRSHWTETLHCIIDTSRVREENSGRQAFEAEMRTREDHTNCTAVVRDVRNAKRIKIACRDGNELPKVKESASKAPSSEFRTLGDQPFPIKVDNTNRTAVLDHEGQLLQGMGKALEKEKEVTTAKIIWLSKKDTRKACGSMVVYIAKRAVAEKLLNEQYFHVAG